MFRRNDDEYAATARQRQQETTRIRPVSRLNTACAELREVHGELDGIESRISTLRERQAAMLVKSAPKPEKHAGRVESVDLRTLLDVDISESRFAERTVTDSSDDFDRRFAIFADADEDDLSRRWLDNA